MKKIILFLTILVFSLIICYYYECIDTGLFNETVFILAPHSIAKYKNYANRYPFIHDCKINLSVWNKHDLQSDNNYPYSAPASKKSQTLSITRGLIIYFPLSQTDHFLDEFLWLYRSWIEMQKYEPLKWRTDIIIFIENNTRLFNDTNFFLNKLNCSFKNIRKNSEQLPMCSLINYVPISKRVIKKVDESLLDDKNYYEYFLNNFDIFNDDEENLMPFYYLLNKKLSRYEYVDSILMAFDGFNQLKVYDFLIRSDIDVFLTPLFAQWLPRHCNDFYVGGGAYSTRFNSKRLKRAAFNIGLKYADVTNLGSTWISTPSQFRLVSYLTLFSMAYISEEEFSPDERLAKMGIMGWPYWHYGVLLLYGQQIALNHLIATHQINCIKLNTLIDYPAFNDDSVFDILHIHVFHGDDLFSKFDFKAGKYNYTHLIGKNETSTKYYALRMALDGKNTPQNELLNNFINVTLNKSFD